LLLPLVTTDWNHNISEIAAWATGSTSAGISFGNSLKYVQRTASTAIVNTASETAFDRSYTIPIASSMQNCLGQVGTRLRVSFGGIYSTTGTPTITVKVKLGTAIIGQWAVTAANNASAAGFTGSVEYVQGTVGVGGTGFAAMQTFNIQGASATDTVRGISNDTTVVEAVTITWEWGAAHASNTATLYGFNVDLEYAGSSQ
jgi:hypothetical protein